MKRQMRMSKYYRFLVYLVVVILINIAGQTLFLRADLTSNGVYSLSRASKDAVGNLSEPLTINVFFTKNLPAPHNNTERYLRDLLEEYAVHSNKYFNYRFYDVSPEEGDIGEAEKHNQQLARDFGIYPVQIQDVEQDEVKFKRAYMGMVFIHGDIVDKIPAITSTDGLEYSITSKIEMMNNKISALVGLKEPVSVKLMFSPSLIEIAPQIRMEGIAEMPSKIEEIVTGLSAKYYGKLEYSAIDPTADAAAEAANSRYNLVTLRWRESTDASGAVVIPAGRGVASIVVEKGDKFRTLPLIEVFNVPLFGTQYQLADLSTLGERIGEAVDDVIDINKKIGYLSSNGTAPLRGAQAMPGQPQPPSGGLNNFDNLVSQNYSITEVDLADGIPDGIDCLIMAGPKKTLNDWELFQVDQFLMKGKSLAIFYDAFDEMNMPQNQMGRQQGPVFLPVSTGLEKMLDHYGVSIKPAYVLDKSCFEQQLPRQYGGGKQPIYFAPIIKSEKINSRLDFMKYVKSLIMLKVSPIELREDALAAAGLSADVLFSSSDESWEMSGRIDLSPWAMQPPEDPAEMESFDLAALITGEFPSWFAGKPVPEKPSPEGEEADSTAMASEQGEPGASLVTGEGAVIEKGKPGQVFLVTSSEILGDNILDEAGTSTQATFIMNVIDHLNGRDAYADMRGKNQRFNPLRDTGAGVRTFVKTLNIAGLPVLVVALGVVIWARRSSRKRRIQAMFAK
jgi:ABC-2 type transport system permease protein